MLENVLQYIEEAMKLFNELKLYVRELESLPVGELVAQARMFMHYAIRKL